MRVRRLAVTLALAALLMGCSGSDGGGSTGTEAPSGSGAVTTAGEVKPEGVLKVGSINAIDSLNPFNYIEASGYNAMLMIYPMLVQYTAGANDFEGDLASKWEVSADGLQYTFTLNPGTWSDGTPITADDAAWTINTTVQFADDATAVAAGAVAHVVKATAPSPDTLVIEYDAPVANVLPQLQTLFILPKHVWEPLAGTDGAGLKTFAPQEALPIVSGGAYSIEKWEMEGTTIFKANPDFYGPKSNVGAIALVYYTNEDAMLADLKSGELDWVDEVPLAAASALVAEKGIVVEEIPGAQTNNITWNSNPKKTKNRELLDPKVKKAISMAIDRDRLIEVVYGGHAVKVESLPGNITGKWENKNLGPLQFDVAAANAMLDELGYAKGGDGVRVVPATAEQPEHQMAYEIMVPDSLNFNGKRQFELVAENLKAIGVEVTLLPGGDGTAAFAYETGADCDGAAGTGYADFDMAMWDWVGYRDPDFMLSVVTKGQWCSWSDTGYDNPDYDVLYDQQATLIDEAERKKVVDQMQQIIYDDVVYTQLVNMNMIHAYREGWTGFNLDLSGYSKRYYTDVRPAG
jgi:peptide/nickel transport system substrate-binding protein